MSVSAMLKEINSARGFFRSRSGVVGEFDEKITKNFIDTMVQQVNACVAFSPTDATMLNDALHDNPYGLAGTKRLTSVIDAKLAAASAFVNTKPASEFKQVMKGATLLLIFTDHDWTLFKDPKKSFCFKVTRALERMNLIGLTHPEEQTLRWLLAILLVQHYAELPPPKTIFEKLQDLKQAVFTERKPYPFSNITEFPETPQELSADKFRYAYTEGAPVVYSIPELSFVAEKIALRKSSKLLKSSGAAASMPKQQLKAEGGAVEVPIQQGWSGPQWDKPQDAHEEALYTNYKASLWRHRASQQSGLLVGGAPISTKAELPATMQTKQELVEPKLEDPPVGALVFAYTPDGSLSLDDQQCSKLEPPAQIAPPASVQVEPATAAIKAADSSDESLDAYSKAAIKALASRKAKKKAEKTAAAAFKKPAAALKKPSAAVAQSEPPAKKAKAEPSVKATVPFKQTMAPKPVPAGAVVKKESQIGNAMPSVDGEGPNPAPVHYRCGVIYTDRKSKAFRALRCRGDAYSEKSCSYKVQSAKEAWGSAIQVINEAANKMKL